MESPEGCHVGLDAQLSPKLRCAVHAIDSPKVCLFRCFFNDHRVFSATCTTNHISTACKLQLQTRAYFKEHAISANRIAW